MKCVAPGLVLLVLAGCDGVPTLTFVLADAGVDGGGSGDADAQPVLSLDGDCPGPNPAGATVCCGSVPCSGDCAGRCPECESTCVSPGTFCCAKTNNILCRQVGMTCN
jgi:hypothetical protein